MEKTASFLFAGTSFNRKKFASDFARFKDGKENDESSKELSFFEEEEPEPKKKLVSTKKRKQKSAHSETVEGFELFKISKKVSAKADDEEQREEDEIADNPKKEFYRQMERDALSRKKYSIHVTGSNIPSPLRSFAELASRYGCKRYILRNLAEHGFKEPTPIQRQAIPTLLYDRECFAYAPTGSGKTFAFICPMLINLKRPSTDGIRAVILSPTRELAAQTARE